MRFAAAQSDDMDAGLYAIPYQTVSMILLGPGCRWQGYLVRHFQRAVPLAQCEGDGSEVGQAEMLDMPVRRHRPCGAF